MHFPRWRRRIAALSAAVIAGVGLAVVGQPGPAQAMVSPACQNGGVLLVFARGSNAKLNPQSGEAERFFTDVESELGSIPNAPAQLGDNGDGDVGDGWSGVDQGEYPAVEVDWFGTGAFTDYYNSVGVGASELASYLINRVNACPYETIVLGGYSQGAEVVGTVLQSVGPSVRDHIGYVALYGDPRFNPECNQTRWWVQGSGTWCNGGILGARDPYLPSDLQGRAGSWCDGGDGVCAGTGIACAPGPPPCTHGTVYADTWITQSAPDIAYAAWLKSMELNPAPPTPPPPSVNPPPGAGQKLAATKNQDGRLGLFYVGGDSAIYYQYQQTPGGYWAEEHRISAYAKAVAATTSQDGRIELFYVGSDNSVIHKYQETVNSHAWSAEENFGTSVKAISAARNGLGNIEVVTLDFNNQIHHRKQTAPNSWGSAPWEHVAGTGTDIALTTSADGRNELFMVGGSTGVGPLMHRWQLTPGGDWSPEEGFSASIVKVAASRNQDGHLEVFAIGDNAHLFNKWEQPAPLPHWYDSWGPLTGLARYVTSARNQDGRLEVFFVGGNNRIYHEWQTTVGCCWSGESVMYGAVAP